MYIKTIVYCMSLMNGVEMYMLVLMWSNKALISCMLCLKIADEQTDEQNNRSAILFDVNIDEYVQFI